MDAVTILGTVAGLLKTHHVDAVLIGCAGAALQGAPVTTNDLDFYFRPTRLNVEKLRRVASALGTTLTQPHYPLSKMYRIVFPSLGIQVDMMGTVYGVKSFESVRSRADHTVVDGNPLTVASLRDIITMKKAANRPKDRAVMPVLQETLRESEEKSESPARRALRLESERAQREQVRAHLALPMNQRTHFLRLRLTPRSSCI